MEDPPQQPLEKPLLRKSPASQKVNFDSFIGFTKGDHPKVLFLTVIFNIAEMPSVIFSPESLGIIKTKREIT